MVASTYEPSLEQPSPASRSRWYAVLVLFFALLVSYTDRFIINIVVDPIRADLGLTDLEISFLQGAGFAVIFAIAILPSGRIADARNRRNLIACGVLVWSIATIACGLASSFWTFFAARVAVGLGEAALVPAASSLIVNLFSPRQRGIALGTFTLGAVLGTGVALLVGGALLNGIKTGQFATLPLIGGLVPWRQLMILVGLPGFLLLPMLLLIREPGRHQNPDYFTVSSIFRRLLDDNGAIFRVCVVKAVLSIGDNGLIAWMPTLLQRKYGMSPLEAGGLVAISLTIGGVTASISGGAISDMFARRWGAKSRVVILLGCYVVAIIGALGVFCAASGQLLAIAMGLWALGSISGYVVGHVVLQEGVPNEMRATTIALSLTLTALIGIALGPTLVALLAADGSNGGWGLQPAMGTVSLFAALLGLLVIWPPIRLGFAALKHRNS